MNKNKKIVAYIVILCFVLASFTSYGANYNITNGNTYVYSIMYTLKNNSSSQAQDVSMTVMLDNDLDLSYQKDYNSSFTPSKPEITNDRFGNKVGKIKIDSIPAGGKVTLKFEKTIKSYAISYIIDTQSISNDITGISDIYLKPYSKIESNSPEIIEKATELTAGYTNNYEKAKKIFEFVNTYMTYDMDSDYSNKGALSALKSKRGVCEDYASLFTALCRAVKIPSRVVSGFRLDTSTVSNMQQNQWYNLNEELHAWPEFYLKGYGWVPVEPTVDYTYNKARAVYWDGFTKLVDNNYVGVNIINPDIKDLAISYSYSGASTPGKLEVSMQNMVKLIGDIQEVTPTPTQIPQPKITFKDVPDSFWAQNSIGDMYRMGVIKGYVDKTYRPNNNITRGEFIAMLSRMLDKLNKHSVTTSNIYYYNDYNYDDWSRPEYDKLMKYLEAYTPSNDIFAGQNAITKVFGYNELDKTKYITREEVCAFLDNFLELKGQATSSFTDISASNFKDSILEAYENGIIKGYKNNTFMPRNSISRAEMAVMFERFYNLQK